MKSITGKNATAFIGGVGLIIILLLCFIHFMMRVNDHLNEVDNINYYIVDNASKLIDNLYISSSTIEFNNIYNSSELYDFFKNKSNAEFPVIATLLKVINKFEKLYIYKSNSLYTIPYIDNNIKSQNNINKNIIFLLKSSKVDYTYSSFLVDEKSSTRSLLLSRDYISNAGGVIGSIAVSLNISPVLKSLYDNSSFFLRKCF